jgi:hypothetical protein
MEEERSWFVLRYYPGICVEGLREITNTIKFVDVQGEP